MISSSYIWRATLKQVILCPAREDAAKFAGRSPGKGKRGGVRIIYTTRLPQGALVLLVIYTKSAQDNIPAHILRKIAEEMGHAT